MLGPNQRSTKRSRSRPFNSYVVTVTQSRHYRPDDKLLAFLEAL